ncbi:Clp protease/crotonase-like domain-containing protein [Jatrophihabitans fulvus]
MTERRGTDDLEPAVLVSDAGAVRTVTLNRPGSRNALSSSLVVALHGALTRADRDDAVTAVVLTGAGSAFCAGVDLKEAAARGRAYFDQFDETDCMAAAASLSKPLIGAVNGAAFTGGLELALACDFLVASETAVFADTHLRVGVMPGGGMTARLPHLVGSGWARRLSMSGEVIDARTALRIGLVTEVTARDALLARATEVAGLVADVPLSTMRALKSAYAGAAGRPLPEALAWETSVARANPPDLLALEERRTAVMARNHRQTRAIAPGAPDDARSDSAAGT